MKEFDKFPLKLKKIHFLRNITRNTLLVGKIEPTKRLMMGDSILPYLQKEFLPKNSYYLVTNFISDILNLESNLRNLVIISHLYFENIIDELLRDNFVNPEAFNNFTFYSKMKVIESQDILNTDTLKFLLFVNKIRNKFAHNLDYDLPDSDFQAIPFFVIVSNRFDYKVKKYRVKRNYYMFAVGCIDVILEIIEQHPKISRVKRN